MTSDAPQASVAPTPRGHDGPTGRLDPRQWRRLIAASVSGLVAAGSALLARPLGAVEGVPASDIPAIGEMSEGDLVPCYGINACKGKGECGGTTNSCVGRNDCAGKSYIFLKEPTCLKIAGGRLTEATDAAAQPSAQAPAAPTPANVPATPPADSPAPAAGGTQ